MEKANSTANSITPQPVSSNSNDLVARLRASEMPVFKKLGEDLEKEQVAGGTTGSYEDSGSSHTEHGTYNDN